MSLEAIEKVTENERKNEERRAAAEVEAKEIVATAQQEGLALLQHAREQAAASGKELLRQAEQRAAERSAEIERTAQAESDTLRGQAATHMEQAAEFIVGRVVNH